MPQLEPTTTRDLPETEVLTLAETAAYLRVSEEALRELAEKGAIAAQQIGGEWRFLKRSVVEWLRLGANQFRDFRRFPPPWMFEHPYWDEFVWLIEQRILSKLPATQHPSAKPGSKEAVLKHFGVFKDDADLEAQLAGIRARREASRE